MRVQAVGISAVFHCSTLRCVNHYEVTSYVRDGPVTRKLRECASEKLCTAEESLKVAETFHHVTSHMTFLEQCQVVVFIADDLGFLGARESRPHDRALSSPRHCLDAHWNDRKKAWRVPTEHLSRGRQSWARKTQNRNVQIRNLAVSVFRFAIKDSWGANSFGRSAA